MSFCANACEILKYSTVRYCTACILSSPLVPSAASVEVLEFPWHSQEPLLHVRYDRGHIAIALF